MKELITIIQRINLKRQVQRPMVMLPFLVGTGLGTLMLFQNCSQPMEQVDQQSLWASTMPFSYKAAPDTVAYMSCAGGPGTANPRAVWTFKVGAYRAYGLKLTDQFFSMNQNYNNDQKVQILQSSPENASANLQLAIRQFGSPQSVLSGAGGSAQEGRDFVKMIGPLDQAGIASDLVLDTQWRRYFSKAQTTTNPVNGITGRTMEGAIRFNSSESQADFVRGSLGASSALLAITFTTAGEEPFLARGPGGVSATSAYGRGFQVGFTFPSGVTAPRVLSSIREVDLQTNQVPVDGVGWVCPTDLRFRIGLNATDCAVTNESAWVNDLRYQRLRSVLLTDLWAVNLTNSCVTQKNTTVSECYASTAKTGDHYISLCYRQ